MRSKLAAVTTVLALAALATPLRAADQPAVKDAFLTLPDGAKIHYLEAGQGSPIVFIPGWTMAADIWEPQIAHFSKSHRVIAYDPRSQGQSSKVSDGSFPGARAYDLSVILEQLNVPSATLVCWSMAVSECIAYLELYGTRHIDGLVLVDGFIGEPSDAQRTAGIIQYIAQFQRNRKPLTDSFVRSMFKKPRSEEYLKHVIEESLLTPTDTAVALFVGAFSWDNSKAIPRIDRPTLLAATENLTASYKKLHEQIPGSRLELFQSGHALFVDEPERFNQVLESFLASVKPQGSGR
jgi:non-heme chloroperoxidase